MVAAVVQRVRLAVLLVALATELELLCLQALLVKVTLAVEAVALLNTVVAGVVVLVVLV
jgi:hypothetical protein